MKVLHLISDWKFTGPVEPVFEMVKGLRRQGIDAHLAMSSLRQGTSNIMRLKAAEAGVPLIEEFALHKHFHLLGNILDCNRLIIFVRENHFDLIHVHRQQDHLVGGMAAKQTGVPLVRSSHDGQGLKNNWRNRFLMKHCTSLYLPVSRRAATLDVETFGLEETTMSVLPPAIDTEVFDPAADFIDMHAESRLPKDKILIGIVARIQRHRHFNDLLDSWVRVLEKRSDVHFVILGRGTHMNEVAVRPSKEKGLTDHVTFTGYFGETYPDMLSALDIKVFLVPGTDGSCRALRQALSLGIPAVTSDRGMLSEIVRDGVNGLVTDGSPEALAKAQLTLCENDALRKKMSLKARRISIEEHCLAKLSQELIKHYEKLLSLIRGS